MGQGNSSCCCQDKTSATDEYTAYLLQFKGNNPESVFHSQHFTNLEDRGSPSPSRDTPTTRAPSSPSIAAFFSHDDLVHPSLNQPMKTDCCSLLDRGHGPECAELCRAVCADTGVVEGPNTLYVAPFRVEGQVVRPEAPTPLEVPVEFGSVQYDWTARSAAQSRLSEDQQALLMRCVKPFVAVMLDGLLVQLRIDAAEASGVSQGQNLHCVVSLTKEMDTLIVAVGGVRRQVPFSNIRWVRPAEEDSSQRSWFLPDEREQMVVLRLAGGRFLRFRLESKHLATYFGTCMRILAKSN